MPISLLDLPHLVKTACLGAQYMVREEAKALRASSRPPVFLGIRSQPLTKASCLEMVRKLVGLNDLVVRLPYLSYCIRQPQMDELYCAKVSASLLDELKIVEMRLMVIRETIMSDCSSYYSDDGFVWRELNMDKISEALGSIPHRDSVLTIIKTKIKDKTKISKGCTDQKIDSFGSVRQTIDLIPFIVLSSLLKQILPADLVFVPDDRGRLVPFSKG